MKPHSCLEIIKQRWPRILQGAVVLLMIPAVIGSAGCGGPQYAEIEGVITINKKPAANLQVVFMPDPEQETFGSSSSAFTDAEGRYHLVSRSGRDGAIVGTHRVCIQGLPKGVPASYAQPAETPLRGIEVKPGKQSLDFDLPEGRH